MRKALTYKTTKPELTEKSAQGTNVAKHQKEFTEISAQGTNVPSNLTERKDNSRKTVPKVLT